MITQACDDFRFDACNRTNRQKNMSEGVKTIADDEHLSAVTSEPPSVMTSEPLSAMKSEPPAGDDVGASVGDGV